MFIVFITKYDDGVLTLALLSKAYIFLCFV